MVPSLYKRLMAHYPAPGVMNGAFHLWEGPDFIYVNNAKSVCTSTKLGLNTAVAARIGVPYMPKTKHDIQNRALTLLKRPSDVPAETVTRLLTGAGITRFTIVRDPFARFISAVADKLNVAKAQPPRKALLAHLGLPAEYSFHTEEVAEIFLGDAAAHHLDKHWRPQRACIAYGLMPYTAIGRAENWEHDFAAISARIFGTPAPQVDTRERYGHRTPPAYHRAADTPRLRRLVADLYAEDYEMLAEISESGLLPA